MMRTHTLAFDPQAPETALGQLSTGPAVAVLYGADPAAEPYVARMPNLRRRLERLLRPAGKETGANPTKRLALAHAIRRIDYTLVGSEFEALLLLYQLSMDAFGRARAAKRLHLHTPSFVRIALQNAYPRIYVTSKVANSAADSLFGPFPSRNAAERYANAMLDLFQLRRCHEELHPDPSFPGCIYSEMKMCLAPCFKGCTESRYQQEAAAVHTFLRTGGEELRREVIAERDAASEALEFERAADAHARMQKVEAVQALLPAGVRTLSQLSGVVVQAGVAPLTVHLFNITRGCITGPREFSLEGMRLANEHSGSSSLFAQPVAVEAVPLGQVATAAREVLEERLSTALDTLESLAAETHRERTPCAEHLALFSRWLHRPQARRTGEVCFTDEHGQIARKALLRAISRVYTTGMKSV